LADVLVAADKIADELADPLDGAIASVGLKHRQRVLGGVIIDNAAAGGCSWAEKQQHEEPAAATEW